MNKNFAKLAAVIAIVMFSLRAYRGLWLRGYWDETTHLLGARVINAGGLLYRDFVDNHGPVIYMLASAYGSLAGWSVPEYARLIPLLLAIVAGCMAATSPALTTGTARLCATGLYFGLLASVWDVQGLYLVSFYPVAGAFAAMVMAWFAAPIWFDQPIPPVLAVGAGIAASLLCFTGYQYVPSVALLAASGLMVRWPGVLTKTVAMFIAGGLATSLCMLTWLSIRGDPAGYLAFHIAFGQTAFRPFIDFGPRSFVASLNPSFSTPYLVQALGTIGFALSAMLLFVVTLSRHHPIVRSMAIGSGLFGILLLNARGELKFKDGSFIIGVIALIALVLPAALIRIGRLRPVVAWSLPCVTIFLLVLTELTTRQAATTPVVDQDHSGVLINQTVSRKLAERIDALLAPNERLLALVYQPDLYLAANRLPIPGFFAYLPWDAAYARRPWFNRPHDLCASLTTNPPEVIVFDNAVWWGYQPRDYMPCLLALLASQYRADPDFPTLYEHSDAGEGPPTRSREP